METIIHIYDAVVNGRPCIDRVVTVSGDGIAEPGNFKVPLGINQQELIKAAGGLKGAPEKVISGGPMMGFIGSGSQPVTKTTNAVLVLPQDHYLVKRKRSKSSIDMKRAVHAAVSVQCVQIYVQDICLDTRFSHHLFMRAATCKDVQAADIFINTFFCCSMWCL